jgi:hypothetical protein
VPASCLPKSLAVRILSWLNAHNLCWVNSRKIRGLEQVLLGPGCDALVRQGEFFSDASAFVIRHQHRNAGGLAKPKGQTHGLLLRPVYGITW